MSLLINIPSPTETPPFDAKGDQPWMHDLRTRAERLWTVVRACGRQDRHHFSELTTYVCGDALEFMGNLPANSVHAVVTDPPYGMIEYGESNHTKLREGKGGVWRIPPSFDGAQRRPVPRFTVLSRAELTCLHQFFVRVAHGLLKILVPGGHVFIASNPLVSTMTFHAFMEAGFEKRGEIIRLVQTLRGGDRPKGHEEEFQEVTVMPRSCWEPWGVFRKSFPGTVSNNLRKWGTGALRRVSGEDPFRDVIPCPPTRSTEKNVAPHPSLKPQRLMRQLVRASLPLGTGILYDPFAGSGSTLAAAQYLGYHALGTDSDQQYFAMAKQAFHKLSSLEITDKNAKHPDTAKHSRS